MHKNIQPCLVSGNAEATRTVKAKPLTHWLPSAQWQRLRSRLARFWFWLTTSSRCAVCKSITHRRWIWLPPQRLKAYGLTLPRVTDGFCPDCYASFIATVK